MYKNMRRKEIIKNTVYIIVILLIAIISTYYIYNRFQENRNIDFNSESLDVTYHETSGDKISITKVTPVTDSVGLSSKSYNISIKNNLTEKVDYKIKVLDDIDAINQDFCSDYLIPKDNIRISVKVGRNDNKVYDLNSLEGNILISATVNALAVDDVAIRIWVKQDSVLPMGSSMHYHGIIQVVEEDYSVAINR